MLILWSIVPQNYANLPTLGITKKSDGRKFFYTVLLHYKFIMLKLLHNEF